MFAIVLGAALLAAPPAAEPAAAAPPASDTVAEAPPESAAWAEAKANRAKIKTAPTFIDGPKADLPEAEKALGHHGPVVVEGIIGTDGRMTEVRIKETSHAAAVDRIAIEAALGSTFTPAKDAQGQPLAIVVGMPFDLVAYKSSDGPGILEYSCAQFVRDMDWWKSVNPDKPFKEHELYLLESGMDFAAAVSRANGDYAGLNGHSAKFEQRWLAAIELCRRKPKMLQRDAIFR